MTRKDYILIAEAIKATGERINSHLMSEEASINQCRGVRRTAAHLAEAFAHDSPAFDVARFLKACGYGA